MNRSLLLEISKFILKHNAILEDATQTLTVLDKQAGVYRVGNETHSTGKYENDQIFRNLSICLTYTDMGCFITLKYNIRNISIQSLIFLSL